MSEDSPSLVTVQPPHLFYAEPLAFSNLLLQTVKVFDGLFLGNMHAGEQQQFLMNNKIGLIINVNPNQIKVVSPLVTSIVYNFQTKRGELQQSINMHSMFQIITQIDQYLNHKLQGVIIISKMIDSRSFTLAVCYFILKYSWSVQQSVNYLSSKKEYVQIAQKYQILLKNFQVNSRKTKGVSSLRETSYNQQQTILKNTIKNAQIVNMPDFHGLCHKRVDTAQFLQRERTIKFVQKIQFIDKKNSAFELSIDIDACPYQEEEIRIEPQKRLFKLNNGEKRLRNFIRDKCQVQGHTAAKNEESEKREVIPKEVRPIPRRRAASKTQQSTEQADFKIRVKQNNFTATHQPLNLPLTIKSQKSYLQEHSQELKSKQKIFPYRFIPKRCQTQTSNHDTSIEQSKVNHLFKISKSNKNSYKKIKAEPARHKIHSYKQSSKPPLRDSLTSLGWQQAINAKINKIGGNKGVVNFNFNVQIDNFNMIHSGHQETTDTNRKNSSKLSVRHLQKTAKKQIS